MSASAPRCARKERSRDKKVQQYPQVDSVKVVPRNGAEKLAIEVAARDDSARFGRGYQVLGLKLISMQRDGHYQLSSTWKTVYTDNKRIYDQYGGCSFTGYNHSNSKYTDLRTTHLMKIGRNKSLRRMAVRVDPCARTIKDGFLLGSAIVPEDARLIHQVYDRNSGGSAALVLVHVEEVKPCEAVVVDEREHSEAKYCDDCMGLDCEVKMVRMEIDCSIVEGYLLSEVHPSKGRGKGMCKRTGLYEWEASNGTVTLYQRCRHSHLWYGGESYDSMLDRRDQERQQKWTQARQRRRSCY